MMKQSLPSLHYLAGTESLCISAHFRIFMVETGRTWLLRILAHQWAQSTCMATKGASLVSFSRQLTFFNYHLFSFFMWNVPLSPPTLCMHLLSYQTLRVQCPKGRFIVNQLTLTSTLSNLQQCIADLTSIPPLQQKSEWWWFKFSTNQLLRCFFFSHSHFSLCMCSTPWISTNWNQLIQDQWLPKRSEDTFGRHHHSGRVEWASGLARPSW